MSPFMQNLKEYENQGLQVQDLSAGYGKHEVISHIEFSLSHGEMTGILGPNGCGKTTLLKTICGLLPSQGSIRYDGQDLNTLSVKDRARLSAYIPQRSGLSIDLSTLDVVLMGFNPQLALLQYPSPDMKNRALDALRSVGLETKAHANYQELSEGQKQLCLLARTMVTGSSLLLLDEPESALDFSGRYQMMTKLRSYIQEQNGVALVTLHDPQLALYCCDRLLLMKDGRLQGEISPATDPLEEMTTKLSSLFGPLSLHRILDQKGKPHLILLREENS